MKNLKPFLLLLMGLIGLKSVQAQNVDEIINKYINAIGGDKMVGKVKTIYMEATVSAMGTDVPTEITLLNGKGIRIESNLGGRTWISVFTDKKGWEVNPMGSSPGPRPMNNQQYLAGKNKIDVGSVLYDYKAKGNKIELLSQDDSTYKLKVTDRDSFEAIYYIDRRTNFLTKRTCMGYAMGQPMEITNTFSDYKKTDDGFVYPSLLEEDYGGRFSIVTRIKSIHINEEVNARIFEMPE